MRYRKTTGSWEAGGFTMIEMVVAVTLIVILILPLVGLVSAQLKRDQKLEERRVALRVCREAMDRLLDPGYPAAAIVDDSIRLNMDGRTWLVAVDAVDGAEGGEIPGGSDPLEVSVAVFVPGQYKALAKLRALKP